MNPEPQNQGSKTIMITQTSCSELLVDTNITDPKVAYERFSELFKELGWDSSPPLTPAIFVALVENDYARRVQKHDEPYISRFEVQVFDANGNACTLEYGDNGYTNTGFRLDSGCDQGNVRCFPLFKAAIDKLGGQLLAFDGGSTTCYEEWDEDPSAYEGRYR